MYDRSLLTFMSRWLHTKTHRDYVVFCTALVVTCSQPTSTVVVYRSQENGVIYVRDIDEFLDGRFLPLDYSSGKEN